VVATWRNKFNIHFVYAAIVAVNPDSEQWYEGCTLWLLYRIEPSHSNAFPWM